MAKKYVMHTGKSNEKKPIVPKVQTAVKTDVEEALEILLDSADSTKKKSLPDKARAFRKRIDEMEEHDE